MKRSVGRTSRRRTAVVIAALIPLAAACSSGGDGADEASAGAEASDASGEQVDGDVVTRNPSQAEQTEGVDGEQAEQSGAGGAGDGDGDTATSSSTTGGGTDDTASSTGGTSDASTTGDSTTGDSTTGTTGGSAGASTTGGETGGSADGETTTGDPSLVDEIPLDEIESIEDTSGLIIADVPTSWIEVDGSPIGDKRALRASPDLAAFAGGYATEGILLEAIDVPSGTANWQAVLDGATAEATGAGCSLTTEVPYDDGIYVGSERRFDCAAGVDVSLFAGTNEDDSSEWLMKLIVSDGDEPTRQLIFQSFLLD